MRNLFALVRTNLKCGKLRFNVIGVIGSKDLFLLLSGHSFRLICCVCSSVSFNLLYRSKHLFICVHCSVPPLLFDISVIVAFLELLIGLSHKSIEEFLEITIMDFLNSVLKVLSFRLKILAVDTSCKHCNLRM